MISIHALLAESDVQRGPRPHQGRHFYPRSPCGERPYSSAAPQPGKYFYPRSPCGERRSPCMISSNIFLFLSTLSLRRATVGVKYRHTAGAFLSTLSLRRATGASAHAHLPIFDFYPRSPCGERRHLTTWSLSPLVFLSTLSLRRATQNLVGGTRHAINFYPRSPCGERLAYRVQLGNMVSISIHALLAESDAEIVSRSSISCQFLSTLSLRRATMICVVVVHKNFISIHALLAESDPRACRVWSRRRYFYPRSPCGERRGIIWRHIIRCRFLSTLSLRRAT